MNRCPITYQEIPKGRYSASGLKQLSKSLKHLLDFPYSSGEQRKEAARRMQKMSIQGVQPKLSCKLNVRANTFEVVDLHGNYIIKPQNDVYEQVPENEDVTIRMAALVGIETPLHGLVYAKDGSFSYFIKRFDRISKGRKLPLEDFSQLAGERRETKYNYSLEKMAKLIDKYCTFPLLEKEKFFKRIIFSYLTGNEDMHLKNFSLISRNQKVEFSPAYDLLNTSLAMGGTKEEMALTLAGKRSNFRRSELIDYFGKERLGLTEKVIDNSLATFSALIRKWKTLLDISFLSEKHKLAYQNLIRTRAKELFGEGINLN